MKTAARMAQFVGLSLVLVGSLGIVGTGQGAPTHGSGQPYTSSTAGGDVNAALLRITDADVKDGTDWSQLRRPLHLPRLALGDECPRTPGGRDAPNVAITLGHGPVYPVLGFELPPPAKKGVVRLRDDLRKGGAFDHKTLWAIKGNYHGPVLIRGRRIDERGMLRFDAGRVRRELRFPPGQGTNPNAPGWRYAPTGTLIPGPGCYAFQIDGLRFSKVIVFEAAL